MDSPDCISVFLDRCSIIKYSGIDEGRKKCQSEFEDCTEMLWDLIEKKRYYFYDLRKPIESAHRVFKYDIKCSFKMRENEK